MIEDFAIAFALLAGAVIALAVRGRGSTVGQMIDRAVHTVRSMVRVAVLGSVWSNPLLRVVGLLPLVIGTGWAATIIQVGVEETRRVYSFDDSGRLCCSKHGSAPGIRSVPFPPAGRNRQ